MLRPGCEAGADNVGAVRTEERFYVIDLLLCDRAKHLLNASGREDHNNAEEGGGWIHPSMGNALADGEGSASWKVLYLAPNASIA